MVGRPTEIDSNQIKMLIDNNQCFIIREIADIFKISKLIKLLVKMKNVSFVLQKKTKQTFWLTQEAMLFTRTSQLYSASSPQTRMGALLLLRST